MSDTQTIGQIVGQVVNGERPIPQQETAVVVRPKNALALQPQSMGEAMEMAKMLASSSMIPKGYQGKPSDVLVAMQWGHEIGLGPLQALQNISVINGRPAVWGDAALALVKGSGLCEYISETIENGVATCRTKRKGEPNEVTRTFSVDDAKRAKLWGRQGPWTQYTNRMLQMRARSWALRDVFPDVLNGVGVAEEVMDIPGDVPQQSVTVMASNDQKNEIQALCKAIGWGQPQLKKQLETRRHGWAEMTADQADDLIKHLESLQRPDADVMTDSETLLYLADQLFWDVEQLDAKANELYGKAHDQLDTEEVEELEALLSEKIAAKANAEQAKFDAKAEAK